MNEYSLVASNNNHNHGGHNLSLRGHAADNDPSSVDEDAVAAGRASRATTKDGITNKVKDGERNPAERESSPPQSPSCKSEERVSPAANPLTVHVKHEGETEISEEHGAEISEEEEMDTSEEPENLSLKPANS